ncbi:hypothetical protein TNCV_4002701 [Trichonephila clavipes]|uniref:Uncharacterized protein n=1 Tax=Trichonephila clavipes TaxID=2585209 RepID=A0A8X6RN13_TRICX|nr:hypothetical protein TNCV_4002701 [Trichonephila clavipes]
MFLDFAPDLPNESINFAFVWRVSGIIPEFTKSIFSSDKLSDVFREAEAGPRPVLLDRWIIRSVPLEIVESSGQEKVPTRRRPSLERPGRPRGERIEGSCGKHLWTPQ